MADTMMKEQSNDAVIASYFRMFNHYEAEIAAQHEKIQVLLEQLRLEAGSTFQYGGQWYQICKRKKTNNWFFKKLPSAPTAWLGKKARDNREDRADSHGVAHVDVEGASGGSRLSNDVPTPLVASPEVGATSGAVVIE